MLVVLPVFWDQYDDAQRIHETAFGIRLDTFGHEPAELRAAAERLLGDVSLNERLTSLRAGFRRLPEPRGPPT